MPVRSPGSWHVKSIAPLFKCSICCSPEDIPDVSVLMILGVHQHFVKAPSCLPCRQKQEKGESNELSGWLWLRQFSAQQHLVPQGSMSQGDPSPNGGWTPHFLTGLGFSLMSPSSALPRFLQVPTGSLWASASCAPCDSSLAGMREVGMRKAHGWRFISLQPTADVGLSPLGVGRKGFS